MAETLQSPTKSTGRAKETKRGRRRWVGRPSSFSKEKMARELHELLDIPLDKFRDSTRNNIYLKPRKGKQIIDAIIQVISDALRREEEVYVQGFGAFKVVEKKRNSGRVILMSDGWSKPTALATGHRKLPPKKQIVFIPSDHMLAMVNLDPPNVLNADQKEAMKSWN